MQACQTRRTRTKFLLRDKPDTIFGALFSCLLSWEHCRLAGILFRVPRINRRQAAFTPLFLDSTVRQFPHEMSERSCAKSAKQAKLFNLKMVVLQPKCYVPSGGHMQQAQMNGHITPAIDGRDANWLRGVELLLIAFRSWGNYKNQYTRR